MHQKKTFFIVPALIIFITTAWFMATRSETPQSEPFPASLRNTPSTQTQNRVITMRAQAGKWTFDPKTIELNRGDHVILKIYNEDEYDHGIAIEALALNKRLPAKTETVIEFDAEKEGRMPFYCSIPCGEGHFYMTGVFIVQ